MSNKLVEVLDYGKRKLTEYSSDPEFESLIFLEEATGKSRGEILVYESNIEKEDFFRFRGYLSRRLNGEPWQYIIGKTNFLGLNVFCDNGVFIPRPETEWMVAEAIKKLKDFYSPSILEIGSGSGAISVAIASNISHAKIIATDISKKAVDLCKKNVDYHNLGDKIDIVCADLLGCFSNVQNFDMIISNPPYIPENDLKNLDVVVKNEPELALNGGYGGVSLINRILDYSKDMLKTGGYIFVELDILNIPYIKVPESINCLIKNDQYGRKRVLQGVKI